MPPCPHAPNKHLLQFAQFHDHRTNLLGKRNPGRSEREKKQAQKVKKEMKKAAELEVDKLKKSKVGNNPNDLAEATLCAEAFVLQHIFLYLHI